MFCNIVLLPPPSLVRYYFLYLYFNLSLFEMLKTKSCCFERAHFIRAFLVHNTFTHPHVSDCSSNIWMYVDSRIEVLLVWLMVSHQPDIPCLLWNPKFITLFKKARQWHLQSCMLLLMTCENVFSSTVTTFNYDYVTSLEERKEHETSCVWNFILQKMWCRVVW